jgi:glycosyltransferase involved in cell wall biosynthesis
MGNARPVIATEVGGVVDLLGARSHEHLATNGERAAVDFHVCARGIGVAPNNAEAFYKGLARLISDKDLRRTMGRRGQQFVEQNYSKERLIADMANLYQGLAGEGLKAKVEGAKSKVKNESSTLDTGL